MYSVSVVIFAFNDREYLENILSDLKRQTYQAKEIIAVDSKLLNDDISTLRNKGAKDSSSDLIMFLESDVRIADDFLQKVVLDFEKRSLDLACPLYLPYNSNFLIHLLFWYINFVFVLLQGILPSGAGACIVVKREIFLREDGFKLAQMFEDMEWIRRVGRKYQFGIVLKVARVSSLRFRTYGMFRTIGLYIFISLFFTMGLFSFINKLKKIWLNYVKKN